MRIMLISTLYEPYARGGAERVVFLLAHGLAQRGHDVHVVTTAPWRDVQWGTSSEVRGGITVHRIFHGTFFFHGNGYAHGIMARCVRLCSSFLNVWFAWRVRKLLQTIQPDVVHTHNLFGSSFLVPWVVRWARIRHIHTLHDIQLLIPSGRLLVGEESHWVNRGFLTRWYGELQRTLWGSPAVVTAPSTWLLHYHRTRNFFVRSTLQTVHHIFPSHANGNQQIVRETFTLLFAGQIERAKGVLMMIRLFAQWCAEHPHDDAELIIVGAGTDSDVARTLASTCPRIHIIGPLPHERVASVMRSADVVVVPSLLYENAPQVIVEALACGKPVSVSDVGGAPEFVRAQNAGWVVPPTEAAWRDHLAWLMEHRDEVITRRTTLPSEDAITLFEQLYAHDHHHHTSES